MRRFAPLVASLLLAAVGLQAQEAPKGQLLYSRKSGEGYRLHLMNADGTGDREIPGQTDAVNIFASWSPDGKRIACMSGAQIEGNDFHITLMDADGSNPKKLNVTQKFSGLPAWSPDGKQIAFTAGEGRPSVFVADAEGNGLRQVNPPDTGGLFPFWTRDGKQIGFSQIGEGEMKTKLVLAKADGSGSETLMDADGLALAGSDAVSPDGKRLLFALLDPVTKKASLRQWEFANKGESTLTEMEVEEIKGPASFPTASWGGDGKSIFVSLVEGKVISIFRLSDDGKTKTRITPEGTDCFAPAWRAAK